MKHKVLIFRINWSFILVTGNMKFPATNVDLSVDNSKSFKYKAALIGKTADVVDNTIRSVENTKTVVPLKYLSNYWRSL